MITVACFNNKTVGVLGLARSGISSVQALLRGNAVVFAWDDDAQKRLNLMNQVSLNAVDLSLVELQQLSALIISPGIPTNLPQPHPLIPLIHKANVPIMTDIDLLIKAQPTTKRIGITGTNGKSTTTSLIGHILKNSNIPTEVGGNIGIPCLDLKPLDNRGIYVLELSSFQLELMQHFTFDAAVLLNITPDHLDRHGTMQKYAGIKQKIFAAQKSTQAAIIGVDDPYSQEIYTYLKKNDQQQVIPISNQDIAPRGVYVKDSFLVDDMDGKKASVLNLQKASRLPGLHNAQNIAAAYATCRAMGLDSKKIAAEILSYPGLAHRQEFVRQIRHIGFVNDSKATNADAAGKALACYKNIYWILGGRPKEGGLNGLEAFLDRVQHAFLIGEAQQSFAFFLKQHQIPHTLSGTLDVAVTSAYNIARQSSQSCVILLSPACASFDQFRDFEDRGTHFKKTVLSLNG